MTSSITPAVARDSLEYVPSCASVTSPRSFSLTLTESRRGMTGSAGRAALPLDDERGHGDPQADDRDHYARHQGPEADAGADRRHRGAGPDEAAQAALDDVVMLGAVVGAGLTVVQGEIGELPADGAPGHVDHPGTVLAAHGLAAVVTEAEDLR
jgi:hypothetical protein